MCSSLFGLLSIYDICRIDQPRLRCQSWRRLSAQSTAGRPGKLRRWRNQETCGNSWGERPQMWEKMGEVFVLLMCFCCLSKNDKKLAKQKQVGKKAMRSSCQVFLQHYKSLECYGVWMCLAWDIGFTDAASTRVAPTRSRPHRLLPKQLGPSIRRIRRSIEMRIEMDQSMRIQSIWMIDQDQ